MKNSEIKISVDIGLGKANTTFGHVILPMTT